MEFFQRVDELGVFNVNVFVFQLSCWAGERRDWTGKEVHAVHVVVVMRIRVCGGDQGGTAAHLGVLHCSDGCGPSREAVVGAVEAVID